MSSAASTTHGSRFFPLCGGLTTDAIVEPKLPTTLYSVRPDGELLARTYNGSAFGAPIRRASDGVTSAAPSREPRPVHGPDDGRP